MYIDLNNNEKVRIYAKFHNHYVVEDKMGMMYCIPVEKIKYCKCDGCKNCTCIRP